jgi:hypothetical protein
MRAIIAPFAPTSISGRSDSQLSLELSRRSFEQIRRAPPETKFLADVNELKYPGMAMEYLCVK